MSDWLSSAQYINDMHELVPGTDTLVDAEGKVIIAVIPMDEKVVAGGEKMMTAGEHYSTMKGSQMRLESDGGKRHLTGAG